MHSNRINHGDIKPGNILIDKVGGIYFIDFGMSVFGNSPCNRVSELLYPYNPPELFTPYIKFSCDYYCDIWSAGVAVYEMMTGTIGKLAGIINSMDKESILNQLYIHSNKSLTPDQKDFLSYILQPVADNRPTPYDILKHPYLLPIIEKYPKLL